MFLVTKKRAEAFSVLPGLSHGAGEHLDGLLAPRRALARRRFG
jgi:hypothetical protein